jgi:hypothetical protein
MGFRDAIASAKKRRYISIEVPLLGSVRLQSLTAGEMSAFRDSLVDSTTGKGTKRLDRVEHLLVAQCVVDAEGNREVTDDEVMQGYFDGADGGAISTLARRVREHTGFGQDLDWKAIEAAAKNSAPTG